MTCCITVCFFFQPHNLCVTLLWLHLILYTEQWEQCWLRNSLLSFRPESWLTRWSRPPQAGQRSHFYTALWLATIQLDGRIEVTDWSGCCNLIHRGQTVHVMSVCYSKSTFLFTIQFGAVTEDSVRCKSFHTLSSKWSLQALNWKRFSVLDFTVRVPSLS